MGEEMAAGPADGVLRHASALLGAALLLVPLGGCTSPADGPAGGPTAPAPTTGGGGSTAGSGAVPWRPVEHGPWPGRRPPLDGEPVTLALLTDGPATQGQPYEFVVRIGNAGADPVSLRPCPAYRVQYLPHVEHGYLNCAEAPAAIAPGEHVDFRMRIDVVDLEAEVTGSYVLLWQLGGEGFEGRSVRTRVRLVG